MITSKALITTAGAALLAATTTGAPISITKVDIGKGVGSGNPTVGQLYPGTTGSTGVTGLQQSVQQAKLTVGHTLDKKNIAITLLILDNTPIPVAQFGIWSGATLLGIVAIPAVIRQMSDPVTAYTLLLPIDDVAKVVRTSSNGQIAAGATWTAAQALMKANLEAAFPVGTEGSVILGDAAGVPRARRLVTLASIVEGDTELTAEQGRVVSMSDVFNNFYRFSHSKTDNAGQPANASELSSWTYDSGTDTIQSTINSATIVGFVSRKKYDHYTLQVDMSSTSGDDDDIGLVIAFYKDPVTGYESKLCVVRSPGGFGNAFAVVKNYYNQTGEKFLLKSNQIAWGNGGYGTTTAESGYVSNTAGQGWSSLGKTRVKVVRNGDIITVSSSEFGVNNEVYKGSADFTFDLSADPDLAVFRGPSPYGYFALSQPNATFKVIEFSGDVRSIADITGKKTYVQNSDGSWTASGVMTDAQIATWLGVGYIFHNPITKKTFTTNAAGTKRIFS